MKILIVDDSEDFRRYVDVILKNEGYDHIDQADDGDHGIWEGVGTKYDLILMDINMPNLDGVKAIRGIRIEDQDTPILVLTSETDPELLQSARDAGATDLMAKPVKGDALKAKVKALLAENTSSSEEESE